jgi:hypothetical protein
MHAMKIVDGGSFTVAPNELIAVAIQKTAAPYDASVSDLIGGGWSPKPEPPINLAAHGAFQAPATTGNTVSMTIDFDFVPAADGSSPPGDRYDVTINGLPSEDTRVSTIFPPGFQSRSYLFTVV